MFVNAESIHTLILSIYITAKCYCAEMHECVWQACVLVYVCT